MAFSRTARADVSRGALLHRRANAPELDDLAAYTSAFDRHDDAIQATSEVEAATARTKPPHHLPLLLLPTGKSCEQSTACNVSARLTIDREQWRCWKALTCRALWHESTSAQTMSVEITHDVS